MSANQTTAESKVTVSDLRALPREDIQTLVEKGLVSAELAAEVFREDKEKRQQQGMEIWRAEMVARQESKKEGHWLESMSPSYREAYREFLNTCDEAQAGYVQMGSRVARLKERLGEQIQTAYQFGLRLPDGRLAFYDRQRGIFVDGSSLQPLAANDAKFAKEVFEQLSPQERQRNAAYVEAVRNYQRVDEISESVERETGSIKAMREECDQGQASEDKIREWSKRIKARETEITQDVANAERLESNFNDVLSEDSAADANPRESSRIPLSFAGSLDETSANGQTSAAFNSAVVRPPVADTAAANRLDSQVKPLVTVTP